MKDWASWVSRAQQGEREAFEPVVRQFQDMAVGYAFSILRDFDHAEDAAQEAFIQAYRDLASLREPKAFPAWLRRIVFKHCHRLLRRRRLPTVPLEHAAEIASAQSSPAAVAEQRELQDKALAAVEALPEAERAATTLFYINGYSMAEVGEFLDVPVSTVKNRLHSARNSLRERMTDMVEKRLKKARPAEPFTKGVLRRIGQIQLWIEPGHPSTAVLTDSKGLSLAIFIGEAEARALKPWLDSKGRMDSLDIHTALVRTLDALGRKIADVAVNDLKQETFIGSIRVRFGKEEAEIDARPSDAINFALRAGAPVLAAPEVVDRQFLKGKDGKAIAPKAAARAFRWPEGQEAAVFANIDAVLKALEKDIEKRSTRQALQEICVIHTPARIRDRSEAMSKFKAWVEKQKGGPLEGAAAGLMGAIYLCPNPCPRPEAKPVEAVEWLEKARRLLPEDSLVAYDLATAYALAGRREDALDLIERAALKDTGQVLNFKNLWKLPRFRKAAGAPDLETRFYNVSQIFWRFCGWSPWPASGRADTGSKAKSARPQDVVPLARTAEARMRELQELLGGGKFLRVEKIQKGPEWLEEAKTVTFHMEAGESLIVPIRESMKSLFAAGFSKAPRPMTPQVFHSILKSSGIQVAGVALLRQKRSRIEAVLVAMADGKRAAVPLDGHAAIAIAIAAKARLLVSESLAGALRAQDA